MGRRESDVTLSQALEIIRNALDAKRITFSQLVDEQCDLLSRAKYQGTELRLALVLIDVSIAQRLQRQGE